ncbi:hypothetical protein M433DRAFT_157588, partial [Acidomyces richmondensis BFW]
MGYRWRTCSCPICLRSFVLAASTTRACPSLNRSCPSTRECEVLELGEVRSLGRAKRRGVGALSELPRSQLRGVCQVRVMHAEDGGDIPMGYNWYFPKTFPPASRTIGGGDAELVEHDDAAPSSPSHPPAGCRVSQQEPSAVLARPSHVWLNRAFAPRPQFRRPICAGWAVAIAPLAPASISTTRLSLDPFHVGAERGCDFPLLRTSSTRHVQSCMVHNALPRQCRQQSARAMNAQSR